MTTLHAAVRIRHQVGAFVATAVDYVVMISVVSTFHVPPAWGTALGAACGGTANFLLGRFWIFHPTEDSTKSQAARYALISLSSLLLNAAGVYILSTRHNVQYIAARITVSTFISVLWNYPMQRSFVFRTNPP